MVDSELFLACRSRFSRIMGAEYGAWFRLFPAELVSYELFGADIVVVHPRLGE
jgi:hypothetical protein